MSQNAGHERLPEEVLHLLREVSTATLATQLTRRGFRQPAMHGLLPLRPDLRLVGQAFTLRYVPAREDLEYTTRFDNRTNLQRLAVESVGPGDVLVIDARGDTRAGTLGNILATRVKLRGAAGIVTDGAFRDAPAFRGIDLPTYSRGQSPGISFTVHHPVEVNVPVGCGGVAVMPGDAVVGDAEGVVIIPLALVEEVACDAVEQERQEAFLLSKIEAGSGIVGVYPPEGETLEEYEEWKRSREHS